MTTLYVSIIDSGSERVNSIYYYTQEIARGKGSENNDAITLDVHAINKLQKEFNLDPTDEGPKYKYTSDAEGNYGE